jgi:hypothetical protein
VRRFDTVAVVCMALTVTPSTLDSKSQDCFGHAVLLLQAATPPPQVKPQFPLVQVAVPPLGAWQRVSVHVPLDPQTRWVVPLQLRSLGWHSLQRPAMQPLAQLESVVPDPSDRQVRTLDPLQVGAAEGLQALHSSRVELQPLPQAVSIHPLPSALQI